jgi:hypothetical protein
MDLSFYKNIKYPLIFLSKLVTHVNKNNDITDEFLFYTMKYFLRFYHPKIYQYNIIRLFSDFKEKYNKTYVLIHSHQKLLEINIKNFTELLEYRDRIRPFIMRMTLENQIKYWKGKLKKLEAINDSTNGEGFFMKLISNENNKIYQDELINRLILIKKLFGYKFFKSNNIVLFTIEDFNNFDVQIRNKIYLKLIIKLRNILKIDIQNLTKTLNSWNLIKYIYI